MAGLASRLLPAALAAQAIGIWSADRFALAPLPLALAALVALVLASAARRRRTARAALVLACAAAAGGLSLAWRLAAPAPPPEVAVATLDVRIASLQTGPAGFRAELAEVAPVAGAPVLGRVPRRVVLHGERTPPGQPAFEEYAVGERVRLRAQLDRPRGRRNPGGRDTERRLARRGVGGAGRLAHPALHVRLEPAGGAGPRLRLARARSQAARRLVAQGEGGGLLAALALGDRGGLDPERRRALARLGLSHLLAVSGLHLGLVAGMLFVVARRGLARWPAAAARGFDPRRGALAWALAGAALYALLAGGGIPVRRAFAGLVALALAFLRRRPLPRFHGLVLAAGAVLMFEPGSLFEPGAQMSFAATAALLAARTPRHGVGLAGSLLAASALAIAATAPLVAVHFGSAPAVGLVANLVAVPVTAVLLLPSALLAAFAALAAPEAIAAPLIAAASAPAALCLASAGRAAALLGAPPDAASPGLPALALAAAAAVLATRTRSPAGRVVLAAFGSLVLGALPPAPVWPPPPRVVFFDVGQGDAVLVQGRVGTLLVDAGPRRPGGGDRGRDVVRPGLAALGVKRLDVLAASHADLDHRGGLRAVIEAIPVGELWLPRGAVREPAFDALRGAAAARGVAVREVGAGSPPSRLGDLRVTALWPEPLPARVGQGVPARNDRSLVLLVEVEDRRVLLPGDLEAVGEAALLASGAQLRAGLLKLAHHGSRTSTTPAFLAAVAPRWAVASAPARGRFGMPHPEVRARLEASGAGLAWTGRDGAVVVGLGETLRVRGWRLGELHRGPP